MTHPHHAAPFAFALLTALPAAARAAPPEPAAPAPLQVDDPMLAPPPAAPRTIKSWDDALALIRAQSPDYLRPPRPSAAPTPSARSPSPPCCPRSAAQGSYTHQFLSPLGILPGLAGPPTANASARSSPSPSSRRRRTSSRRAAQCSGRPQPARHLRGRHRATEHRGHGAHVRGQAPQDRDRGRRRDARRRSPRRAWRSSIASGLRSALERLALTQARLQFGQGTRARRRPRGAGRRGVARAASSAATSRSGSAREALGAALGSHDRPSPPEGRRPRRRSRPRWRAPAASTTTSSAARTSPRPACASRSPSAASTTRSSCSRRTVVARAPRCSTATSRSSRPSPRGRRAPLLNVPLYDGGVRYGALKDSRAALEQARQALVAARLDAVVASAQAQRGGRRRRGLARRRPASSATSPRGSTSARATATPRGSGRASTWSSRRSRCGRPRSTSPSSSSRSERREPTPCSPTRSVSIESRATPPLRRPVVAARRRCPAASKKGRPAPPPPPTVLRRARRASATCRSTSRPSARSTATSTPTSAPACGASCDADATRTARAVKAGQLLFTIESTEYAAAVASAQGQRSTRAQGRAATTTRSSSSATRACSRRGMISQQDLDNATASLADTDGADQAAAGAAPDRRSSTSRTRRSARRSTASRASRSCASATWSARTGRRSSRRCRRLDPIRVNFPHERGRLRAATRSASSTSRQRDLAWAKKQFAELDGGRHGRRRRRSGRRARPRRRQHLSAPRRHRHGEPPDRRRARAPSRCRRWSPTPTGCLRPGQYGRVRIQRREAGHDVLVVPEKALISVQGSYSVGVVGPDNKVQLRRSRSGRARRACASSPAGVAEGDRIVVDGVQKITDGALVDPSPRPVGRDVSSAGPRRRRGDRPGAAN